MRIHPAAHKEEEIVFDEVKETKACPTAHPLMQDKHYKCLNGEKTKIKKFKMGHPVGSRSFHSTPSVPVDNSKGIQKTVVLKNKVQEEPKSQRDSVALQSKQ